MLLGAAFIPISAQTTKITDPTNVKTLANGETVHVYTDEAAGVKWYFTVREETVATVYLGSTATSVPKGMEKIKITDTSGEHYYKIKNFLYKDAPSGASDGNEYYDLFGDNHSYKFHYTLSTVNTATIFDAYPTSGTAPTGYTEASPLTLTVPETVTDDNDASDAKTPNTVNAIEYYNEKTANGQTYDLGLPTSLYNDIPLKVVLPSSLVYIEGGTFTSMGKLMEVDWSKCTSLEQIRAHAFYYCENMRITTRSLPSTLKLLGDNAFTGTGIHNLTLSNTVDIIGTGVFDDCTQLEYIDMRKVEGKKPVLTRDADFAKNVTGATGNMKGLLTGIPEHVLIYAPYGYDYTANDPYIDKTAINIVTFKDASSKGHCYIYKVFDTDEQYDGDSRYSSYAGYYGYDARVPAASTENGNVSGLFYADKCVYNRTFPKGWSTHYLTCPMPKPTDSNITVYEAASSLRNADKQENGYYAYDFTVTSDEYLKANKAYLLYNGGSSTFSLADNVKASDSADGILVPVTEDPVTTSGSTVFTGSTEDISNDVMAGYQAFGLNATDQVWRAFKTGGDGIGGRFRAFIADNASGAVLSRGITMTFTGSDGKTTSIDAANAGDVLSAGCYYSLDGLNMGSDINALPAGIYIKNGKKIMKH